MIYPTARAAGLTAACAPLAALVALLAPAYWLVGPCALLLIAALILIDAALGARRGQVRLDVISPPALAAGSEGEAIVSARFPARGAPDRFELALEGNERVAVTPRRDQVRRTDGETLRRFSLKPGRRGAGLLRRVAIRWRGPLGLVWKQRSDILDRPVPITLNIAAVKDEAMRLFARNTPAGARMQRDLGGGSEFHALREFQVGMDHRTIDWKQSARHGDLLAKEFRAERNHQVMLVIDTGRLMCEPIAGLARLDHALNAALLLAYVSLKTGDRVGLFGFDARPNVASAPLSGPSAFAQIQHLASRIDYDSQETNYTLGLTQLASRLRRRSLLVVFTEFADTTSAELMLETLSRLLQQHLIVFVVMRDEELEAMEGQAPDTPEDVSRAAVAAALLQERELVIERLRRMGVLIVEARAQSVGPALINRYLDLKRRDLL